MTPSEPRPDRQPAAGYYSTARFARETGLPLAAARGHVIEATRQALLRHWLPWLLVAVTAVLWTLAWLDGHPSSTRLGILLGGGSVWWLIGRSRASIQLAAEAERLQRRASGALR